jgi:Na+/H+ antiporter NhaD/arsenite permease-like protein
MEASALIIFLLVYLGMILGAWPGFALDRTGIALLGAIAFIVIQNLGITQAANYIDFSAIAMLFSFMIISAQFYYSGFYTRIIQKMENWTLTPSVLLGVVTFTAGILSAVLINDIVCLAMAPLIIKVCFKKKLNPVPFLLALACASNIGSALTLVGNPQNLLIGQVLHIPFAQYFKFSLIPCLLSLLATWLIIRSQVKSNWHQEAKEIHPESIAYDSWQSWKGIVVILILLVIFTFSTLPRDQVSLAAAGVLLLSRRMASQTMLNFIDWQLLVLFVGLFIVNKSLLNVHDLSALPTFLQSYGIDLTSPLWIILISLILSNIVSNVPAVMLLLPFIKTGADGSLLALSSTFAGNLFIVGSIANIIVITQAAQYGVHIDWKRYVRTGLPVTLASFLIMILWLLWVYQA